MSCYLLFLRCLSTYFALFRPTAALDFSSVDRRWPLSITRTRACAEEMRCSAAADARDSSAAQDNGVREQRKGAQRQRCASHAAVRGGSSIKDARDDAAVHVQTCQRCHHVVPRFAACSPAHPPQRFRYVVRVTMMPPRYENATIYRSSPFRRAEAKQMLMPALRSQRCRACAAAGFSRLPGCMWCGVRACR